jgi:hypothetical protein
MTIPQTIFLKNLVGGNLLIPPMVKMAKAGRIGTMNL